VAREERPISRMRLNTVAPVRVIPKSGTKGEGRKSAPSFIPEKKMLEKPQIA